MFASFVVVMIFLSRIFELSIHLRDTWQSRFFIRNHEVLTTNQWCKPNAENELARAMLRRRPLMPNGNGSPKGQRSAVIIGIKELYLLDLREIFCVACGQGGRHLGRAKMKTQLES